MAEILYDVERIRSILDEMQTLAGNCRNAADNLHVPDSLQGQTRTKLEEITELYRSVCTGFSDELINILTEYARQKRDDMVAVDMEQKGA